jgi:hypothetical protein
LDDDQVEMPDGRAAEIYSSFAIGYGRACVSTEAGLFCLGDRTAPFRAEPSRPATLTDGRPTEGAAPAALQVVPAEVLAGAGESLQFEVRAYDAQGRLLGTRQATWTLQDLAGAVDANGTLRTDVAAGSQLGKVVAQVGSLTASARVRVIEPLPWSENFETGKPPHWIGGGPTLQAVQLNGEQVLVKKPSPTGIHRHSAYFGPTSMSGYTIQADVMGTGRPRRMPDIGLINTGYMLDLQGNAQRVELRSWEAELRVLERVPFKWEPEVWYTMKLRVESSGATATVRGKIWRRGDPEPADWLITRTDENGIAAGSPGIIAFSNVDLYYDNVQVMVNQ